MNNALQQQHSATILVVDDDPTNLTVLADLLEPHYQVQVANSGGRALRLALAPSTPDLILLDVMMPGMDGYEVLRRLRSDEHTRTTPVIFVTALDDTQDETKGFELGASDYITKPIHPAVVLARINNLLEMKQMRDELSDRALQLEHEVAKRTEALNNALVKAEAAKLAKQEFISSMSHELHTPMNGIMGMLELAMNGEGGPEFLAIAYSSAQALNSILSTIIEYAAVTEGHATLQVTAFQPAAIAREVIECFSAAAQAKAIKLACQLEPGLPETLEGDMGKLTRILTILIDNAVKYTDEGGVELKLTQTDGHLQFHVTDTGCGIAPEKLETVFAPFSQADGSYTRQHGGIGLGLNLASDLVNFLGGSLQVESRLGQGSTFSFTLPLHGPETAA